jgi:GH24 family phage-related lysozyme (muramidase)
MNIVGKFVDLAGFAAHVEGLVFTVWTPQFVVVHNTSAPTLANYADWRAHPERHGNWTPEQWLKNLAGYYSGLGWNAGPHAFVCPDGVGLFTPFTQRGTHSPAWNSITWGIETVGEFETEPFDDGSKTNLIAVLGILHARIGLNPADYKFGVRGIHFHKEDPITTHKTCPGKNMVKADLVADVVAYMQATHPGGHAEIPIESHTASSAPPAPPPQPAPQPLPASGAPASSIPDEALTFLVGEEDGSQATYVARYTHWEWPGGISGPTCAIGYDLGQVSRAELIADWTGIIDAATLQHMQSAVGLQGAAAQAFVQSHKNEITITWAQAITEFKTREVPKWLKRCRVALPNFDALPGLCQGALFSLTYNRGAGGYADDIHPRNREMYEIRQAMIAKHFAAIPALILAMQHFWPQGGDLWRRRAHEAALFQKGLAA